MSTRFQSFQVCGKNIAFFLLLSLSSVSHKGINDRVVTLCFCRGRSRPHFLNPQENPFNPNRKSHNVVPDLDRNQPVLSKSK